LRRIQRDIPEEGWQAEFVASLANSGLAPLTVRAYRHDVDLFFKWFRAIKGGQSKLSELTAADVLSYRQHLADVARLRSSTSPRALIQGERRRASPASLRVLNQFRENLRLWRSDATTPSRAIAPGFSARALSAA